MNNYDEFETDCAKAIIHSATGLRYDDNPRFALQVAQEIANSLNKSIATLKGEPTLLFLDDLGEAPIDAQTARTTITKSLLYRWLKRLPGRLNGSIILNGE